VNDLRRDKAALEVAVNDASGLRSLHAFGDGPGARLFFASGQ
jgi:hypothetical protein